MICGVIPVANSALQLNLTSKGWTPIPVEVWDYTTLKATYAAGQVNAKVFYITPKLFIIRFELNDLDISDINTMLQLKFPGYVKDSNFAAITGGSVFLGIQNITVVQGTGVGLYLRPNVTKALGSSTGTFNGILFCMYN